MLSKEDNERFTRVGPGTPMGEVFRRYWLPVGITSDLGARPKKVRILGEDLVLFRTKSGGYGLIEEQCPHRRASLLVGFPTENGIRCGYHGWEFGCEGQCLEQPAEPAISKFHETIRAVAYPVQESSGLIFAYLGPAPAPLLPAFDILVWDNVLRDIGDCVLDFNWLQCMENSVDPHHVEWLHGHYMNFEMAEAGEDEVGVITAKHEKIGFDPFEFGIIKRRVLEGGSEEDDDWKVGHPLVFPYMLKVGGGGVHQFQMRVPIDDTHTWHIWLTAYKPGDNVTVPVQCDVPHFDVPIKDADGNPILDFIDGQDIAAWGTQGVVADRTRENLAKSDIGIILLRRMIREQIERVERGEDPIGTVRDPERNTLIDLPMEQEKYLGGAAFREVLLNKQALRHSPIKDLVRQVFADAERSPTLPR